jgi:hypothetical protein
MRIRYSGIDMLTLTANILAPMRRCNLPSLPLDFQPWLHVQHQSNYAAGSSCENQVPCNEHH